MHPRLAFAFVMLGAAPANAQLPTKPDLRWDKMVAEVTSIASRLDGVMGVSILDLTDRRSFVLNGDQVFPTASTIKLPLLMELYRQDQDGGGARLLDHYTFDRADLVDGSEIMRGLSPGVSVITNRDLAQFMVAVSDNAATNVLIGRVGMEKVNAMLRMHGLTQTTLRRRMMDLAAAQRGDENIATPRELTRLLELLAKGEILKPTATQAMVEQLATGKDAYIPRRLPSNVRVANKPGSLDGVRVDAGIVYAAHRPFAIAVMTSMNRDERAAEDAISQVALAAYGFFDIVGRTSPYGRVMP